MNIKLENGKVIIELWQPEFTAFEAMFANLGDNHTVLIRGEEWPQNSLYGGSYAQNIVPFHLCRTIDEARAVE